jgi:hypothetical protein
MITDSVKGRSPEYSTRLCFLLKPEPGNLRRLIEMKNVKAYYNSNGSIMHVKVRCVLGFP